MESDYTDKITIKLPPCKPPEPCLDDYDPCESSDDITDKDLADLLKEEELKLQREKENAGGFTETGKPLDNQDKLDFPKSDEKWGNELEESGGKKRNCKKFIKNPFFSNRLSFSSCQPPRPSSPPPQFYPPVEETSSKDKLGCLKRKRRKCRKTDDGAGTGGKDGLDGEGKDGDEDADLCVCIDEDCMNQEGGSDDNDKKGGKGNNDDDNADKDGKRKRCRKQSDKPPCRKKESEIAIFLQPRHIPAIQKDLPPTSPKDIKRIEEYLIEEPCKKKCKRKKAA